MSNHTIDKIKTLTEMHGAPNFEQHVREYMKKMMAPYVDTFVDDRMGGFYGVKKVVSQMQNVSWWQHIWTKSAL